jgi:peptidoglycan/LPS O-acetylase OafA/YrhL
LDRSSYLAKLIHLGYSQVSFFFLLSGYILAFVYLRDDRPVSPKSFFLARFARIYPLLFLTLLADTPYLFYGKKAVVGTRIALRYTLTQFAGNVTLLQAWTLRFRDLNEASWSLSAEAVFYLWFPFLGALLWKLRGARLWFVATALYVGGLAIVFIASGHAHGEAIKRFPPLHMATFSLGILLARWQTERRRKPRIPVPTNHALAYALLLLAIGSWAAVVYYSDSIPIPLLHDGLLAPIFMVVIWAFSHSDWLPARILSLPWLVVLGEASFGLYLIHLVVLHEFALLREDSNPVLLPVFIGASIALSVISFYLFETPTRKWILKRSHSRVKETIEMASNAQ